MNVQVVVRVIVKFNDKILLVKKRNAHFWHFPGGKLDKDESIESCAVREVQEETNIEIDKPGNIIWVKNYDKDNEKYVELFFTTDITAKYKKIPVCSYANDVDSDIDDVEWTDLKNIYRYNVKPEELVRDL